MLSMQIQNQITFIHMQIHIAPKYFPSNLTLCLTFKYFALSGQLQLTKCIKNKIVCLIFFEENNVVKSLMVNYNKHTEDVYRNNFRKFSCSR